MTATVTALLLDLNGLFRHFYNEGAAAGEAAAGLPRGTIARYAYEHPNYRAARVGLLTDQQWAKDVADRLVRDFGSEAQSAISPWRADRGHPDPVMIDLLGQAREHVAVGVLSNFTNALQSDLALHGINFDYAFSSADLGVDKPSPLAYRAAADRMGVDPRCLYYFDDQPTFVSGAHAAGLPGELFTGPNYFAARLNTLGIPVRIKTGAQR